jgi:hypothetical protein
MALTTHRRHEGVTKGKVLAGKRRGKGEGSIYFRASDEKWTGSLTMATGKRKVFHVASQEEVRRKLAKAVHARIALMPSTR